MLMASSSTIVRTTAVWTYRDVIGAVPLGAFSPKLRGAYLSARPILR